jgi:hypothetical protein
LALSLRGDDSTFGWVFLLVPLSIIVWSYIVQIRYLMLRYRSKHWPSLVATLQKGSIGRISFGKGASAPATFIGYAYIVQGMRYAGFFALYGNDSKVRRLHADLAGGAIQIRYHLSDPNVSLLVDYTDQRFDGLAATQNPDWLDQSPPFDLQDAVR